MNIFIHSCIRIFYLQIHTVHILYIHHTVHDIEYIHTHNIQVHHTYTIWYILYYRYVVLVDMIYLYSSVHLLYICTVWICIYLQYWVSIHSFMYPYRHTHAFIHSFVCSFNQRIKTCRITVVTCERSDQDEIHILSSVLLQRGPVPYPSGDQVINMGNTKLIKSWQFPSD